MAANDRRSLDDLKSEFEKELASIAPDVRRHKYPAKDSSHVEVLMRWVAQDDACPKCRKLAAGSPYTADSLPSWPGTAESTCGESCRCVITADPETWNRLIGNP